ncbi:MAG: hypothetical protein H0U57_10315 [Tatlockia sp.]|nr:hypothetical protein [Tatlockia sp.]
MIYSTTPVSGTIENIAKHTNAKIRGWINYYGKFHLSEMNFLYEAMNYRLVKWLMHKFKRYRQRKIRAWNALKQIQRQNPKLFSHWSLR